MDTSRGRAFVFPGQGSQSLNMGQEFFDTFKVYKHTIEEASDILKRDMVQLIKEGPLTPTQNAQPAILTASFATYRALSEQMSCDPLNTIGCVAGHSLGEITALLVSGALGFAQALKLVAFRGEIMSKASEGGMCAIIGLDAVDVESLLTENVYLANDNCIGQIVISGHKESVETVAKACKAKGAKMTKMLDVSGPFHTPLMQSAKEELENYLSNIDIMSLKKPYYPNILAKQVINSMMVKDLLEKQIVGRVRWRETLIHMYEDGIREIVEIGPGKVLQGLAKRVDKEFKCISLNTPYDIENFMNESMVCKNS